VSDDVYTTTTGTGPAIVHYKADRTTGIRKLSELDVPGLDAASIIALVHVP
jgi:hypothetical protein